MTAALTFQTAVEAFEYACEHLDCSLKDGRPVLAVVLAAQERICCVKIANRDDRSIPTGTLNELLARTDLTHVCFSAMLASNVPPLQPGDLVTYTTMPELAAIGKTTVAGTVLARVHPHYTSKGGWQAFPAERKSPEPDAAGSAPANPGQQ